MDTETAVLFGLVALIGLNQVLARVEALQARAPLFWSVQVVNAVIGALVIVVGLPGFEWLPPVSWVVGLLFYLHIGQNIRARAQTETRAREEARRERDRRAAALRAQVSDE